MLKQQIEPVYYLLIAKCSVLVYQKAAGQVQLL